jgi:hypothetical protein
VRVATAAGERTQPGLSKAKVSEEHLALLGVTEDHLFETFEVPFSEIASA